MQVREGPVIPVRFKNEVDQHLIFNFADMSAWPLVLGVFGRPGDGKSFQVRTHIERRGENARARGRLRAQIGREVAGLEERGERPFSHSPSTVRRTIRVQSAPGFRRESS